MATIKKTTVSSFVSKALAQANKTEDEVQLEKFTEFAENAIIDVELIISSIETGDIPRLNMELKSKEAKLVKARASYETTRYQIAATTAQYVTNRENALDAIDNIESSIKTTKDAITNKKQEVNLYKSILADFNS